ncbi:hypothetical protein B9Z55_011148 [Caenorhabditis nigoni]|uniref:Sdz-33 F-box domain-containing protein n=1 Tax=Caenorhabditis nigoni TaxID=1611254 RepID=A0A2G5UIU6_9PELO|nr:hypothetical protein B9Z55_011148 [Caenorhabditis nigoni]
MGRRNKKGNTNFNDIPVNVEVHKSINYRVSILIWSNLGMSWREWIQHLCSISKPEKGYTAFFEVYNSIEFNIPTLRNIFPKVESLVIFFSYDEAVNEHEKLLAQIFLKAFLPDVENVRLDRVRLGEHFSIGDFGMTNLKELVMNRPRKLRVEDLITLNAESITIGETNLAEITFRDLNRFFKLWKKGFNRKLKELKIWWYTRTNPDWNILLKELKADDAGEEELPPEEPLLVIVPAEGEAAQNADVVKKFIIRHSRKFVAEIKCYTRTSPFRNTAHVKFTVS